ncbi:hypothetical protein G5714_023650 [Onychostoma macrolepis]|uniref:Uncharacterized protein n=1 Tax=Onychostoma macrolepis TaxID=369639 RepID=A0A7J6BLU3_9TELE|nr:hypothetical protein G5714_023650 [Onychostoma macrolepis]
MAFYRTDCVEKPVSKLFEKLGHLVGSYPVWFFVIPLIMSAALGGGLYFLKDHENNDVEKQFTLINGPSKKARQFVKETFPRKDVFLGSTVGGVEERGGVIQQVRAIRLFYFLQDNNGTSEWLQQFQNVLSKKKKMLSKGLKVSHFTSLSRQEEIEKHTTDGIPLFSITYSLAISFSVLSCMR